MSDIFESMAQVACMTEAMRAIGLDDHGSQDLGAAAVDLLEQRDPFSTRVNLGGSRSCFWRVRQEGMLGILGRDICRKT